jgi:hypothetical protein
METPIIAALIIASATLIVGAGTIYFWYWHTREQQRITAKDNFVTAGKKLVATFEPAKERITNYRGHPYFFELVRFLTQQFPKHKEAVHGFREHLLPDKIESFDKAWSNYHGNNEKYPNFSQYKDHIPSGLLSRIEEILKFTK